MARIVLTRTISGPNRTPAVCLVAYSQPHRRCDSPHAGTAFRTSGKDSAEVSCFGYAAARAAYGDPECEAWRGRLIAYLRVNRDYAAAVLRTVEGVRFVVPEASYLLWIDATDALPPGTDAVRFFADAVAFVCTRTYMACVRLRTVVASMLHSWGTPELSCAIRRLCARVCRALAFQAALRSVLLQARAASILRVRARHSKQV